MKVEKHGYAQTASTIERVLDVLERQLEVTERIASSMEIIAKSLSSHQNILRTSENIESPSCVRSQMENKENQPISEFSLEDESVAYAMPDFTVGVINNFGKNTK